MYSNPGDDARDVLDDIEDLIDEHGWMVQGVFRCAGEPGAAWVYTVGLDDLGHPELLVVGLEVETAGAILNRVVDGAMSGARRWPAVGDTLGGLFRDGYAMRVVAVDPEVAVAGEWFNVALARRGSPDGFRPLQLVWQELDYSWPVESTDGQPLLGGRWW